MAKNYHLKLLETCGGENPAAQEAIDYALQLNLVPTTGDFQADVCSIMSNYDAIIESWHQLIHTEERKAA